MRKLLLLMFALLTSVSGAWAQITVGPSTGVYWKNGAVASDAWAPQWKSNALAADRTTPLLVFTGKTGMNTATGDIYSNQAYTLEVPAGYFISSYTFNGTATGGDVTITPSGESGTTITSGDSLGSPLDVTVRAQSTSFALSGSGHIESLNLTVTVSPIPVVLACSQDLPGTFGSFSGQTYTTSDASNLAGVTVTASTGLTIGEETVNVANYGKCFRLVTAAASTDYTVTMTAPTGYVITGYYIAGSANTKDAVHTLTSADDNVSVVVSAPPYNSPTGPKVFEVTGLNANSTYFTINTANKGNTLYLPKFIIYVAKASEVVAVTYNVVLGASGTVKATTTNPQVKGSTITLPAALTRDYCTYTYYSDAACTNQLTTVPDAATSTVYALATYTMPFTVSTDFANATWYYVNAHATYNNRYISTNGDAIVWGVDNGYTDAYKWAFIGNPYDGFQVINKAVGNTKCLQETDPLTMGTTAKAWPVRQQTNTSWQSGTNGFGLWSDANSKYVNAQSSTLKYWGSFDQGSTYWVTEVPTVEVNVTYDLYVGGEKVNTVVEEHVAENSAVSVPASLTANYNSLAYDITTSGTIGSTDCTITVTATLKSGIVQPAELSNSKKYRLTTSTRGSLSTYTTGGNTYLASPVKTSLGVTAKEFAIINYNNNLYLYSVDDQKFVTYQSDQIAPLADMPTATDAVSFSQTTNSVYEIRFDNDANKNINSSASYTYGVVINNWGANQSDWDDGCQYIIEEVGDFDATDAIAALSRYMIESYYDSEKQHNVMSAGKVGYPKTDKTTYTNLLGHIQTLNAYDHVYTESDYTTLVSLYEAYVAESDVVLPTAGKFYRFKGAQSGKYLKGENSGTSDRLLNTAGEEGAKSIFYLDASSHLLGYSTGQYVQYTSQIAAVGAEEMNTFEFEAPKTAFGALSIKASPSGNNNGRYLYSHTGTENYANRNGGKADETDWYIEEVTALPVSTTSNIRYATFCSPVEVSIPGQDTPIYDMSDPSNPVQTGEYDEVTAFQAKIDGDDVKLVSIDDGVIPANFPVVLKMHFSNAEIEAEEPMSKTRNLPINYGAATHTAADYHSNALEGTIAAITVGSPIYTLQYNETSGTVGFYRKNSGTLKGFKAYLSAPNGARFQGFSFEELTGISAIIPGRITIENAYDLQGRRAGEVKKGVYIVNGKKVLF